MISPHCECQNIHTITIKRIDVHALLNEAYHVNMIPHRRSAKNQTSLWIRTFSPESSLLTNTKKIDRKTKTCSPPRNLNNDLTYM